MAIAVEMPKMSDTMEEGVLVAWLAEEGDAVAAGDVVAQVETDKATMDLEVYDDGVLLKKVVADGASVPIGGLIAVLGKEGEDVSELLAKYEGAGGGAAAGGGTEDGETEDGGQRTEDSEQPVPSGDGAAEGLPDGVPEGYGHEGQRPEPVPMATDGGSAEGDGSRVKASPLARRMAQEGGLDLSALRGSGPEGRIVKRDVAAALEGKTPAAPTQAPAKAREDRAPRPTPQPAAPRPVAGGESYEAVPITQMRKTIARRLAESKFTAPHFYLTREIDMARAVEVRAQLNATAEAQGLPKISFNDLVTKACAAALRLHPDVNASYLEAEGEIRRHRVVNVAVAVAIDEGLLTPVVRDADRKGLAQIAQETKDLAGRARDKTLQPADWEGSTFTTSNLGMFGIEAFTAIINPPNACILAIGAIRDVPVVEDGAVVPGKRMKVTLSCDHRVVDGATGAQFLQDVVRYLEEPMTLLL